MVFISDEVERTTGHEKRPISTGDLNSDCLQRLITVHTMIVPLQSFFDGLCPCLHEASVFPTFTPPPLFFLSPLCFSCVAVVKIKDAVKQTSPCPALPRQFERKRGCDLVMESGVADRRSKYE